MLRATVKSLLARKLRLALSAFAIVLGVAFVAGSYVFTDTIDQTFEEIFAETTADIVVRPAQSGAGNLDFTGGDARTIEPAVLDDIAAVDGVDRVDGYVDTQSMFVVGADGTVVGGNGPPRNRHQLDRRPSTGRFGTAATRPGPRAPRRRRRRPRRQDSRPGGLPGRRQRHADHARRPASGDGNHGRHG